MSEPLPPPGLLRRLRLLSARYDLQALVPPDDSLPAATLQAAQAHPGWAALLAWCHGPEACAARAWPDAGDPGPHTPAAGEALAHTLGLVLDGSLQLQACRGAGARLALRLRTKLHDVAPWRARQPTDPWDAGWLRPGETGLQALHTFTPRRPTLLLAAAALGTPHQQQAEALLGALHARSGQRLRLLCLRA